MYKILEKETLAENIFLIKVEAAEVAERAQAGQFIILRIDEKGERIPLTIADSDENAITLVIQKVGKTTKDLDKLKVGDTILDFVGPLGNPTEIKEYGIVVCVGGGLGIAPIYPIARALMYAGNKVITILGARTKDLLIWEDKLKAVSDELIVCTDDGSYGKKGFVTDALKELTEKIDHVFAIGPPIMMKFVSKLTKEKNIPTTVSINSIMIDGMGMCGGCRITVGGETKFACVDGPDFDAHKIDWDEFITRNKTYEEEEDHVCKVGLK